MWLIVVGRVFACSDLPGGGCGHVNAFVAAIWSMDILRGDQIAGEM